MRRTFRRWSNAFRNGAGAYRSIETSQTQNGRVLIVAEHDKATIRPSTLHAVAAAASLGKEVHAVLFGSRESAEKAKLLTEVETIQKVWFVEDDCLRHSLPEPTAEALVKLQESQAFGFIVGTSSTYTKNIFPRAAALLGVAPVTDVLEIVDQDTFVRPIYAGNALATVRYKHPGLRILTVRSTAFPQASFSKGKDALWEHCTFKLDSKGLSEWVSLEESHENGPDLNTARVIIAGGRGVGGKEEFLKVQELATRLGGAVGATRAVVDSGMLPNDLQIGQTGKVVAPELYLAVGVSGAIQHVAGMKDSKVVVAINKDKDAPIFKISDYGLVADSSKVLSELLEKV